MNYKKRMYAIWPVQDTTKFLLMIKKQLFRYVFVSFEK